MKARWREPGAVADALNLANFAGIMKIYLIKYAKFANNSFEMGV